MSLFLFVGTCLAAFLVAYFLVLVPIVEAFTQWRKGR